MSLVDIFERVKAVLLSAAIPPDTFFKPEAQSILIELRKRTSCSAPEMLALLQEVRCGYLDWIGPISDKDRTMSEYADEAHRSASVTELSAMGEYVQSRREGKKRLASRFEEDFLPVGVKRWKSYADVIWIRHWYENKADWWKKKNKYLPFRAAPASAGHWQVLDALKRNGYVWDETLTPTQKEEACRVLGSVLKQISSYAKGDVQTS